MDIRFVANNILVCLQKMNIIELFTFLAKTVLPIKNLIFGMDFSIIISHTYNSANALGGWCFPV